MQISLIQILEELSSFGLNPKEWLIGQMSIQKDELTFLFESAKDRGLQLKGKTKGTHLEKLSLDHLEWVGV